MADEDDDLIDLLKRPEKLQKRQSNTQMNQSDAFDTGMIATWNPSRRDNPNVLLITFAGFALICVVVFNLRSLPGGLPIAALVIYTLLIPYILSNRFLSFVPWLF